MIMMEDMMIIAKSDILEVSKTLNKDDIAQLVEWLSLKDDNIRYNALLLLQNRSALFPDVYPYWSVFQSKLNSDNSYQRNIGLSLIAENVKWDQQNQMEDTIDQFLTLLNDEKPITIRQCVQALGKIASVKPNLSDKIVANLISFDLMLVKETMRKSILLDILNVLLIIRKGQPATEIEDYIFNALAGGLLDKKAKKEIEALL